MGKTQETSNELGNSLYKVTLKEVIKNCKNTPQKIVAGYLLERADATQVFNFTDVLLSKGGISESDDLCQWIKDVNDINVKMASAGVADISYGWTPYVDDLFAYAYTHNDMYYCGLIHRLDEERAIMFFGVWNGERFTVFESVTFAINPLTGVHADYSHMLESVHDYIKSMNVTNPARREYLIAAMDTCFLAYFTSLLRMFSDLTNKNEKKHACYVDETADARSTYFRAPLDKRVTKIPDKPVILILNNDKEITSKVEKYRIPRGKIHYAFSWVVRGHYRKLHNPKSLGMDRNGKRCIQGMTWIETYMKGDENLPLLKRERIVKP